MRKRDCDCALLEPMLPRVDARKEDILPEALCGRARRSPTNFSAFGAGSEVLDGPEQVDSPADDQPQLFSAGSGLSSDLIPNEQLNSLVGFGVGPVLGVVLASSLGSGS